MRFKVIDLIGSSALFPKRKYFTHFRENCQKPYDTNVIPFLSTLAAAEKVIWARISIVYNKSEIVEQMLQIPILDSIIETHFGY